MSRPIRPLDVYKRQRPSKVINWEYVFYIDAVGHIQESPLRETLPELEQRCV